MLSLISPPFVDFISLQETEKKYIELKRNEWRHIDSSRRPIGGAFRGRPMPYAVGRGRGGVGFGYRGGGGGQPYAQMRRY